MDNTTQQQPKSSPLSRIGTIVWHLGVLLLLFQIALSLYNIENFMFSVADWEYLPKLAGDRSIRVSPTN